MNHALSIALIAVAGAALSGSIGCEKKPAPTPAPMTAPAPAPAAPAAPAPALPVTPPKAAESKPAAAQPAPSAADDRMAWWRDARFGMFIHWGVYAVPAGTHNGKTTGGPSEWLMQSLKVPTSEYVKFADSFTADKYDPGAWAKLAKQAGMKYIVITSRHHDGFCLWDSAVSDWDVKASPTGRDLLKPLADATRAEGLRFCTYYSILDWRHPDYEPRRAWNDLAAWNGGAGHTPDFNGRFVPYVHAQVEEVVTGLDPDVLWFDGEWEETWTQEHGRALYNKVRSLKPSIIVNNRVGKSRNDMAGFTRPGVEAMGDFCTPEKEVPATGIPGVDWETCMTMNDSWGFKASDSNYKSAEWIVQTLCDVASKGGNFLLNVGPKADGTIPQESIDRLNEVGRWMTLNGDSIYGTTASPFRRLPGARATVSRKGGVVTLSLMVFDWPKEPEGRFFLPGLRTKVNGVRVITADRMARSPRAEQIGLGVMLSDLGGRPAGSGAMPVVVRLELAGEPEVSIAPIPGDGKGNYVLKAGDADVEGKGGGAARLKVQGSGNDENLGFWTEPGDSAVWTVTTLPPGDYRLEMEVACQPSDAGSPFEVALGPVIAKGTVPSTGSWSKFTVVSLGGLKVSTDLGTPVRIEVRSGTDKLKGALMNLRQVRVVRIR
ncbi:MAG TPA: alpha-L-fucosidase [Phycisphaerales bacterium]|nr:alpha-L-fucosidase [Phycisphaerales bacterium]